MKKNKEISKESSEKDSTWLCHSEYYKKSKLCIRNGGMCVQDWNKLKKYIPKCSPKDLLLNLCNFRLNDMYNMGGIKFTKLIVIYELLILQFSVVMGYDSNFNNTGIEKYLCEFCKKFSIFPQCNQLAVSIPVTLLFFLFVITMFSLICCNCRCGKKNKDKYVEYGRFIMGPDGKMYDRLMMNPQMFQDGKIPEEMCQEGMQEQGMRGPEVQEPEMQQTESKEPGMQQTERNDPRIKQSKLQEPDMNENENKHKNKKRSTDYNNPNDDELHVGYKPF